MTADHTRIQLADYLQDVEIETHILVQEEDSVRADWWRASCTLHDWYTTGSKPNVEDAAAHHVAWDHTACADVDPESPADAPLYCRSLPGHSDDHWNGGRTWANHREPTTPGHPGMTEAGAHTASLYFATDSAREGFAATFGDKLDTWFMPEFAQYVRTGTYPPITDGLNAVPATTPFAMQQPAYEVENRQLWKRAAETGYARVQAELSVAQLRLALISVLNLFTKKRHGVRDELRSTWVEADRVKRWRHVFEETSPVDQQVFAGALRAENAQGVGAESKPVADGPKQILKRGADD